MAANNPLQQVLLAPASTPNGASQLRLFGQFEGAWDVDVRWFEKGKVVRRARGEWHFGWILGGRAVQDVWIVPTRAELDAGEPLYEYGTSVRFFDPELDAWRSTWIGPAQRSVRTFIARQIGDEIVLEGEDNDGRAIQWVFSDIAEECFFWRFQVRRDRAWEVVQAFECRRSGT